MPELGAAAAATLPTDILQRLPEASTRAQQALQRAVPTPQADRLLQRVRSAATVSQRVHWLRQAADAWAKPLEPHAACRAGCAHCCHVEVLITDVEARAIGQRIGVTPSPVPDAIPVQEAMALLERGQTPVLPGSPAPDAGYAAPCPFLAQGRCSIHVWRPLVCRVHLSLDRDDLLCRLVPGHAIPVPYADARMLKGFYLLAQPAARLADVRGVFPQGLKGRS